MIQPAFLQNHLNKMDAKRPAPRHIIIKMLKVKGKERISKAARKKQLVTYRGVLVRLSADFQKKFCRLEGISKKYSVMKSRDLQPKLLYPAKLSFNIEGQEKTKGVHHHQTVII